MSPSESRGDVKRPDLAIAELEQLVVESELSAENAQRLLALGVRAYARQVAVDRDTQPFPADTPRPDDTEIAIATSSMLGAAGIEIFELGLWRAWSGAEAVGAHE